MKLAQLKRLGKLIGSLSIIIFMPYFTGKYFNVFTGGTTNFIVWIDGFFLLLVIAIGTVISVGLYHYVKGDLN